MRMTMKAKADKYARVWMKVLAGISLGKAFVAGAGLGMAALGIVDIAGYLGIRSFVDFIHHENILDVFAIGGGVLSVIFQVFSAVFSR